MKIFVSSRIVQFNHSSSRASEPCRNPTFYSILLLWFYLILPYSTWLKYLWKDPSKTSSKQLPQQVPNKKATNFPNMYCNKPLAVETKKNLHIVNLSGILTSTPCFPSFTHLKSVSPHFDPHQKSYGSVVEVVHDQPKEIEENLPLCSRIFFWFLVAYPAEDTPSKEHGTWPSMFGLFKMA